MDPLNFDLKKVKFDRKRTENQTWKFWESAAGTIFLHHLLNTTGTKIGRMNTECKRKFSKSAINKFDRALIRLIDYQVITDLITRSALKQ